MTYCAAWKTENSVFMIADTAVTFLDSVDLNLSHSSFGELQERKKDRIAGEALLKINNISNKVLITYAGTISIALRYIDFIKDNLEIFNYDIRKVLEAMLNSLECSNEVLLLVGFIELNKPILLRYENGNIIEIYDTISEIGSISTTDKFSEKIKWMINEGTKKIKYNGEDNLDDRKILSAIVATAQCHSITYRLLDRGVGGLITGAMINKCGLEWCEDISYYICTKPPNYEKGELITLDYFNFITYITEGNSAFVGSSFVNGVIGLFDRFVESNSDEINKLFDKAIKKTSSAVTKYFVIFSPFNRIITFIDINKSLSNNFFRLWVKEHGESVSYRFAFHPGLYSIMNFAIFDEEDKVLFNWVMARDVEYMTRKEFLISEGHDSLFDDWEEEYI